MNKCECVDNSRINDGMQLRKVDGTPYAIGGVYEYEVINNGLGAFCSETNFIKDFLKINS